MQGMGVQVLNGWQTFYVILGSAAATLTGLMFIVVTLMAGARFRVSTAYLGVAAFSTPTVVHFCSALVVAFLLSAPWQALWNVSLVLGILGSGEVIYLVSTIPLMRQLTDYQAKLNDWLWYFALPLILYIGMISGAVLLLRFPIPALYGIAAVTIILLVIGIRNAWDLVVYLAVERSHPEDDDHD